MNEVKNPFEFFCSATTCCKTWFMITRRLQLPQGVLLYVYMGKEVVTLCLAVILSHSTEVTETTKALKFFSSSGLRLWK